MWHDNETDIDLLGFGQFVDMIIYLAQDAALLPLTIGIFGDWGSGKSSLMRMAHNPRDAQRDVHVAEMAP